MDRYVLARSKDSANSLETLPSSLEYRLATIEGLLREVLDAMRDKHRKKAKRARAAAHSAYVSVISDPTFRPNELQMAVARRALRRNGVRK
jgi:uncharacterized membrane protein